MRLPRLPLPAISPTRHRLAMVLVACSVLLALVVASLPTPEPVAASHTNIKFPFEAGTTWSILQGYNTDPSQGGTHYNCDPNTLRDTVSQSVSCSAAWQYRYSIDLYEANNRTAGLAVLSPVNGTVRWTQASTGGVSINLGDGYAVALFHIILSPGIDTGSVLTQGQVIGTVAPAGVAGAGNNPHIHMTLWKTADGGNWSRTAVPFNGATAVDGVNLPDLGAGTFNQHRGKQVVSTNQRPGGGSLAAPAPVKPGMAAKITSGSPAIAFGWTAVAGATEYQISIDDEIISPWLTGTSWTSPTIRNGTHKWKVRARNAAVTGPWSGNRSLTIDIPGNDAPMTASLSQTRGAVGTVVTVSATGFAAGERVEIRWDSSSASPMAAVTASSAGSISTQVSIPDAIRGGHTVHLRGASSGRTASVGFEVTPSLARTPTQGAPGTNVEVTVRGFGANEVVVLNWKNASGPKLGEVRTNGAGTGKVTISIPNSGPGWTDYVGTGQTTRGVGYGAINVLSKLYLSPGSAGVGARVQSDAGGVPPGTAFTVTFNGSQVCSGTSTADGVVRCGWTVPEVGAGAYDVVVKVGSVTLGETLVVIGPPAVSATPGDRAVGINITVTAGGFAPNETVSISWDNGGAWQSLQADQYGSVSVLTTVPEGAAGPHTISARGASSGRTATSTYNVGSEGNLSGSSMLAPGVYEVFATREGLVGGTTSSGHVIVPNDYFVALPGCTPSNCKGGFTPGNMTQCGSKCYVKVVNPVTNVCRVEPIFDTGPWFTVDDWWNPTSVRYLNNLPSNPNTLAQGYPASEAARYGLDVGYGKGPNGIGYDNTGTTPGRPWREVGNPAAIDLADGTWYALAPQGNSVGATIRVEMIWQTGADPAAEASLCGHPLNQRPGDTVTFPAGQQNPNYPGSKATIVNSASTPANVSSRSAHDGNVGTNWHSGHVTPTTASLRFDLGSDREISGVKWMFAYRGYTDDVTVVVVDSAGREYPLGRFGNGTATGTWFGTNTISGVRGRYVHFRFNNPGRDTAVGSISEVQIWTVPSLPPGATNPSFGGSRLVVTNAASTPNSVPASYAVDGQIGTAWSTGTTGPSSASLRLDLGMDQPITGVRWRFGLLGQSDRFEVVLVSASGQERSLGTFGNGTSTSNYYGVANSSGFRARYVRISFSNPNGDDQVGNIAELEVWGNQQYSPGVMNPNFAGREVAIVNGASTPSVIAAGNAYDGNPYSNWYSGHSTPASGSLRLDLGTTQLVSGVKWMFTSGGFADRFQVVLVAQDGREYTLGTFGNGTRTVTWFGDSVPGGFNARYVHFRFANPNRDSAVGSIGEVQVWGATSSNTPGAQNPALAGSSLRITNSADTPTTGTAPRAHDGSVTSNWSVHGTPSSASLRFDLGTERDVRGVKWRFAYAGYASSFTVVLVDRSGDERTFGPFGNGTSTSSWFGFHVPGGFEAQYVRFYFSNPTRMPAIGSIGEVQIWGYSASAFSAASVISGQPDPALAGAPLPVSCVADPVTTDPEHAGAKACDLDGGTEWHTDPTTPATVTLTVSLDAAQEITGIKWNFAQQGGAERFDVSIGNGDAVMSLGSYAGGAPGAYEGIPVVPGTVADRVTFTFTNVDGDVTLGHVAEIEVWGPGAAPAGTPIASPEASPAPATPEPVGGTPEASPVPVATEIPATPEPVIEDVSPTVEAPATEAPTEAVATPAPATEEPTSLPTEPATLAPTPTVTLEPTATETSEPTATETVAPEPTAALTVGTITGTDGDLVNCRLSPVDGEPITQLAEGDVIDITGPAEDGWLPVVCAGQPGYISEDFVTIGTVTPTEAVTDPTAEATEAGTETPTEEATTEPTVEPTLEPTETPVETPYPVVDTGDTEDSGTAWLASDGDPQTWWAVTPFQNPQQTRLYLDLGAVLPIDRITLTLATWDQLPVFEVWLSEDGETWYNATPNGINGWTLERDVELEITLGYDARYLRLVIPNVDESGLPEVGGIAEIAVWPGDITQTSYLTALGEPTTPTPEPEPTEEPTAEPTEEPTLEPTEEVIEEPTAEPTEEWVEPTAEWIEPTVEELPVEGGEEMPPEEEAAG